MSQDPIRAIADAVLYEGYILWPYRRSALKNQRRFTFGGVYPPAHTAAHPDDADVMRTEVLLQGETASQVQVTVRFLHVVQRDVARRDGTELVAVDELVADGERHLAWEEAVERELATSAVALGELQTPLRVPIAIADGREEQALGHAGALVRSWRAVRGELCVQANRIGDGLWRISAEVRNTTELTAGSRQEALRQTFCSNHTLLRVTGGAFISAADPPDELAAAAAECCNLGTWPVLVGEPGERSTMLSSPIILEDHPRIAPESPGDLFDGGEIDQLLILNILTLTDEEKAEMAASDPRAREILERTEALTPEQVMALHGTVREFGLAR
ncbi:MAG: hypothetical protein LC685_03475 [Actinobacteria bacterium]|nr:hypothetical protein [Actinomycetota bacterium]